MNKWLILSIIIFTFGVIFSCQVTYDPQVRVYNMDDTIVNYIYVGTTRYAGINAHSKTSYKTFKPGDYKIRGMIVNVDTTTDTTTDLKSDKFTFGAYKSYTIAIEGGTAELMEDILY